MSNFVEINPNPPCLLCDEPIFGEPIYSRSDKIGFFVAGLFCCVDCYDGPPMYSDEAD